MRFFAPKDEAHVSHSIVNLQGTDKWFEAPCMTLRSVCQSLSIAEVDILKLDVEGAEYEIVKDVLAHGPRPKALCFEFDELRSPLDASYPDRIYSTIRLLKHSGYFFRYIKSSNTLFLRQE